MEDVLPGCDPAEVADHCAGLLSLAGFAIAWDERSAFRPTCGSWHHFPRSTWRWRSLPASISETATCCRCIPLPLLFAAVVWEWAGRSLRTKTRRVAVLMLLAALNAADALRYAPGYLSYFTPFVRSGGKLPPADRQQPRLGTGTCWLCANINAIIPDEQISLSYFGSVDPSHLRNSGSILWASTERFRHCVVSATNLSGQFLSDPRVITGCCSRNRSEILDHSLYRFPGAG